VNRYRKLVAALVGAALEAVSLGLIPDPQSKWVGVGVGFLTAAGVYVVPNKGPVVVIHEPPAKKPPAVKSAPRKKAT
jgi:hypothetical protein